MCGKITAFLLLYLHSEKFVLATGKAYLQFFSRIVTLSENKSMYVSSEE